MKVLVTAFKPFNKSPNNYSIEVLKYIENVDKMILDVIYDESYNELNRTNNLNEYDLIIALGEARNRNDLMLEVKAVNLSDCKITDNQGTLKTNEVIDGNFSDSLNTKVNIKLVEEEILFSNDAGKFVCNNLYFHLLSNYPEKSLFIHIPECNNDITLYKKYALKIKKIINLLLGGNNENQ